MVLDRGEGGKIPPNYNVQTAARSETNARVPLEILGRASYDAAFFSRGSRLGRKGLESNATSHSWPQESHTSVTVTKGFPAATVALRAKPMPPTQAGHSPRADMGMNLGSVELYHKARLVWRCKQHKARRLVGVAPVKYPDLAPVVTDDVHRRGVRRIVGVNSADFPHSSQGRSGIFRRRVHLYLRGGPPLRLTSSVLAGLPTRAIFCISKASSCWSSRMRRRWLSTFLSRAANSERSRMDTCQTVARASDSVSTQNT